MESQKKKTDNMIIGASGEFYVAAELSRRNFNVSVVGNLKLFYDIIAVHNTTHKTVLIQVKTTKGKKKKWLAGNRDIHQNDFFYVFVNLISQEAAPEYYIVPSNFEEKRKKEHHNEYLKRIKKEPPQDPMYEFLLQNEKECEKYRNNWQLIERAAGVDQSQKISV